MLLTGMHVDPQTSDSNSTKQAAGSRSRTERKRSYVTGEACLAAEAGLSCKGRQSQVSSSRDAKT